MIQVNFIVSSIHAVLSTTAAIGHTRTPFHPIAATFCFNTALALPRAVLSVATELIHPILKLTTMDSCAVIGGFPLLFPPLNKF